MGKRISLIVIILSMCIWVVQAQQVRDYALASITYSFSEDQTTFTVEVAVENQGADASGNAPIVVTLLTADRRELLADEIPPLANGENVPLQFLFLTVDFPSGSRQSIEVSVGVDGFELDGSLLAQNNVRSIIVPIPDLPDTSSVAATSATRPFIEFGETTITFAGIIYDRDEILLGAVVFVGLVVLFWIMTLILRLLFRKPARFGVWKPPYGMMPIYDQNSVDGRRQAWQQHAQNGLILAAATENNLHPVKLLLSADGHNLRNWKVTGMRLSQYDSYGRIARSQMIADKKWVKRFNNVLRKADGSSQERLYKQIQPVAKGFVKQFKKKLSKKNAFLPVAFDVRLEGQHGDVRIVFELYQCQKQAWYRLDQWEPTMMVVSRMLEENYSFTIHGRANEEKLNAFYERLQDDIIWLLMETLRVYITQNDAQPHETYDIPDTLSGMDPITESSRPQVS